MEAQITSLIDTIQLSPCKEEIEMARAQLEHISKTLDDLAIQIHFCLLVTYPKRHDETT